MKRLRRTRLAALACGSAVVVVGAFWGSGADAVTDSKKLTPVKFQLDWYPQGEFAGSYVAQAKGWYKDAGLDVKLLPGGPNLQNPASLLLTGAVDIALMQPAQVLVNRSRGANVVDVYQYIQGPVSLYVAKKKTGIRTLKDVMGKRVGLWFGGDEFEFLAMLKAAGIPRNKVKVFAQGFTIVPWLQDKYEVMQVVPWNELQQAIRNVGLKNLSILSCKAQHVCLVGDGLTVADSFAKDHPETVQAFINATARGWAYAVAHPKEAAAIVVKAVPTLKLSDQIDQMKGMIDIICQGATPQPSKGLGYLDRAPQQQSYKIMKDSGQLKGTVDISSAYTLSFWKKIPAAYKHPRCAAGTGLKY